MADCFFFKEICGHPGPGCGAQHRGPIELPLSQPAHLFVQVQAHDWHAWEALEVVKGMGTVARAKKGRRVSGRPSGAPNDFGCRYCQ